MIRLDPSSARLLHQSLAELYAKYRGHLPDYHRRHPGANFVGGDGPTDACLAVVGEAPGWQENHERRPFVGPSGRLLDQWLAELDQARGATFVTNVVKYRPPNNATPNDPEIAYGRPCLAHELQIVGARLVLVCGATAQAAIFPGRRFKDLVGALHATDQRSYLVLYHPAACLRSDEFRAVNADALARHIRGHPSLT